MKTPSLRGLLAGTILLTGAAFGQNSSQVQTESGPVAGQSADAVSTFLGIPYAAPPLGSLRWQPPQPVAPWTNVLQAREFRSQCMQVVTGMFDVPGERKGDIKGSEDCLYLNIYAPANGRPDSRIPTMVWLHGGGFILGAGSQYDGRILAQKQNVVVVTLNYRLGALGFLALPALKAEGNSGNFGIMDQQAALQWVKRNIGAFGGDRNNVTVFGESAGGLSVCAHLTSPPAEGLFEKAIIQSGLCGSPNNNVMADEAEKRNVKYASKLGCKKEDLSCLRKADARKVTAQEVPGRRPLNNLVWSPVYGTPLLPMTLPEAFEKGKFHRVPILNGTNHDEGRFFIGIASPGSKPLALHKYWIGSGLIIGARKNRQVLQQYPYKEHGTPAMAFATMFTDGLFSCPALRMDNALSKQTQVYAFEFNDPRAVTTVRTPPGLTSLGSFHSSSLVYAFQTPLAGLADPAQFNRQQRELSDDFSTNWATFAKTGKPADSNWQPFQEKRGNLQIFAPGNTRQTTDFSRDHQCDFWSRLALP